MHETATARASTNPLSSSNLLELLVHELLSESAVPESSNLSCLFSDAIHFCTVASRVKVNLLFLLGVSLQASVVNGGSVCNKIHGCSAAKRSLF